MNLRQRDSGARRQGNRVLNTGDFPVNPGRSFGKVKDALLAHHRHSGAGRNPPASRVPLTNIEPRLTSLDSGFSAAKTQG